MVDDYFLIKTAFQTVKSAKIQEDLDVEGNPILKIEVNNIRITFYFDVNTFKDEANFSNIIVEEVKR
jgi:hypothetical protein